MVVATSGLITSLEDANSQVETSTEPTKVLKACIQSLDKASTPELATLRKTLAEKQVTFWKQERAGSPLRQLPSPIFAKIFSLLPVAEQRILASSHSALRELCRETIGYCPDRCGKVLSALINMKDEVGLDTFLGSLFQTRYAGVPIRLCLNSAWERLSQCVAKVHQKFPGVQLQLSWNFMTDAEVKELITTCPEVTGMEIITFQNALTQSGLAQMKWPETLTTLSLRTSNFATLASLQNILTRCPSLQQLTLMLHPEDLNDVQAFYEGIRKVSWPRSLTKLSLASSQFISFPGFLQKLFSDCPKLETLCMNGALVIPTSLEATNWPRSLRWIDLQNCAITEESFAQMLALTTQIERLDLCGCFNLLECLNTSQWPASLQHVSLGGSQNVMGMKVAFTLKGLVNLFNRCPALTNLMLFDCRYIGPNEIRQVTWPPSLTQLAITKSQVDEQALRHILECCPQMTLLTLNDCHNLSQDALARIRARYNSRKDFIIQSNLEVSSDDSDVSGDSEA